MVNYPPKLSFNVYDRVEWSWEDGNWKKTTYFKKTKSLDWKDGLEEITQDKMKECIDKIDELQKKYDDLCAIITQERLKGNLDDLSTQFWNEFANEYLAQQKLEKKWLNYWTRLAEEISDIPVYKPRGKEEFEIKLQRARERLIEDFYEGNLRRSANRLMGVCPFHEERTPSFFIFDDNHFYCFGCNEHGSVIDFIMKLKDMDFKEAVEYLQ